MSLQNSSPLKTNTWNALENHFQEIRTQSMKQMFQEDGSRAEKFTIEWNDFLVDFSKNRITNKTLELLLKLAEEMQLKSAISSYFGGEIINRTEDRAVLHTALRASDDAVIKVDGTNVIPEIVDVKAKIKNFTHEVTTGIRKGYTGKAFTDIVNIGIGGSDLGPAMVVEALQYYQNHLNVHFISNIDGDHVQELLKK